MSPPLVSIVIPAYNHASYLAQAVASVLAQDYPSVELIVLNDGSTDDTVSVLSGFNHAFYWETHANMGQADTLTKGWSMARGEILSYLSADDLLEPGAVSAAVSALKSAPYLVAVYCDFKLIDPASRLIRYVRAPEYDYDKMLTEVSCPVGPGAFFRRSAYEKAGPWNSAYHQMPDYDFWLRLGLCGQFARIPQILAGFRVHKGSQTYSQTTLARAEEPVQIVNDLLAKVNDEHFCNSIRCNALASALLVSAQLHMRAGRFLMAVRHMGSAYRHSPSTVLSVRVLRLLGNAACNRLAHRLLWRLRSLRRSHSS